MPVNKESTSDSTSSFLETTGLFSRPFSVLQLYREGQLRGDEDMLATAILPVQTQVMKPVCQAGRGRIMHLVKFEQILCFLASWFSLWSHSGGSVEMTFNSVFLVPNSQKAPCSRRAGTGGGR